MTVHCVQATVETARTEAKIGRMYFMSDEEIVTRASCQFYVVRSLDGEDRSSARARLRSVQILACGLGRGAHRLPRARCLPRWLAVPRADRTLRARRQALGRS